MDAVIYTHDHADQTAGIFELRPFVWKNKKKIPIYGSQRTIQKLKQTANKNLLAICFVGSCLFYLTF